jgi:hypothetical protein
MSVAFFAAAVAILTALAAAFYSRKGRVSDEEVLATIARFVSNTPAHPHEWDDFISVPISDKRLDRIRQTCASLPERYPSPSSYCNDEGVEVLREMIRELRAGLPRR